MFDFEKNLNFKAYTTIKTNFASGKKQIIFGLTNPAQAMIVGLLGKGSVFVAKDILSGSKVAQMLTAFNFKVQFLTGGYQNGALEDQNLKDDFFAATGAFVNTKCDVIIAVPNALVQKVPSKQSLIEHTIVLQENSNFKFSTFSQKLVEIGYEKTQSVVSRGEFSVKGDVVILAPLGSENLFRIEFFDDLVEKITEITAQDKKFVCRHTEIYIYPRTLLCQNQNILSLTTKAFFDEPKQIQQTIENLRFDESFIMPKNIFTNVPKCAIAFSSISGQTFFKADSAIRLSSEVGKNYYHNIKEFVQELKSFQGAEKQIFVFCGNSENKQKLEQILEANFVFTRTINGESTNITLLENFLPQTVFVHDMGSIFFGTHNLFGRHSLQKSTNKKTKLFMPKINDYVVHEVHGVGKCIGLEKMRLAGFEKEYLIIEYKGGDKLYLPSEQANSLSVFTTREENPKLNKLGGADFTRVKEKVFKSVKEMAFNLLKLYAAREKAKGTVYPKDDYLMEKFEEAFMFTETPDQLRAIADIKADMESPKIMDRLVCGDVGFGKTEVALRAIYKAVLAGSQVAFLCPTTILAQQHYKTCLKRFEGFMVKTARFNRLMSKAEEKQVLAGLADGTINVVVGTHKLLSKNVCFKNLTLLVLDEEQRFGVEDKEKIKTLKNNIDVLSLSATPIPRTLHMSLTGIRDISVIETPPVTRQSVQTFVTEFDESVIKRAIKLELSRQGQVLIVFNNIERIYQFAAFIRDLSEGANVGVAHGKMPSKMLEDSIIKLYSGEYQILVSTTLIENGVDLPSANTLIVVDADHLGLSQAYQIRGRIGRGDKLAYAYFLIKPNKTITDTAYKRLSALMENTALGSGIKIAMADLDIRGAGNVLGKEQSGNMQKVGYDLYYKLLSIALKELKGEKPKQKKEVKLNVEFSAYIPETFIENQDERLKMITEISGIETRKQMQEYILNLKKVYQKVPEETINLARLSLLKNFATNAAAKQITINKNGFKIYFYEKNDIISDERGTILENLEKVLRFFEKQNP